MHSSVKKLFWLLGLATLAAAGLVVQQLRSAAAITVHAQNHPLISSTITPLPEPTADRLLGNPGAALTLTAFLDLNDTASKKIFNTLIAFVDKHPTDVRFVWKDLPYQNILFGNNSLAHAAAWCAGKQQAFWPFIRASMLDKHTLTQAQLEQIAAQLKLDMASWRACVSAPEATQAIKIATEQAHALGIQKAPAIFINNKAVNTDEKIDWTDMLTSFITK